MSFEKSEYFSRKFTEWRGESAASEETLINTAILINNYVASTRWAGIREGLVDANSKPYVRFEKFQTAFKASILYGRLIIDEYCENLNAETDKEELALLLTLLKSIASLDLDIKNEPQIHLDILIAGFKKWMTECVDTNPDKTKTYNLCKAIYTSLKILDIKLKNLNWALKSTAGLFVDLTKIESDLEAILAQTSNKIDALESQINSQVEIVGNTAPKTLDSLLSETHLRILTDDKLDVCERIQRLESKVSSLPSALDILVRSRERQRELLLQKKHAEDLLAALQRNSHKAVGRKYFLALIQENATEYEALMAVFPKEATKRLIEIQTELECPGYYRNFMSAAQYTASWAFTIPNSAARYIAPGFVEGVSEQLPDTLDSEAKRELKNLIKQHLEDVSVELDELRTTLTMQSALFDEDAGELGQFAMNVESSELIKFSTSIDNTKDLMVEALGKYRILYSQILKDREVLQQFEKDGLHKEIEAFIEEYDGFFVWLSNLFAQLSEFFKTDTARAVDEACMIKKELVEFEKVYNARIDKNVKAINDNPNIPGSLKISLLQKLSLSEALESDTDTVSNFKTDNRDAMTCLIDIRLKFSVFKTQPKPDQEISADDSDELIIPLG